MWCPRLPALVALAAGAVLLLDACASDDASDEPTAGSPESVVAEAKETIPDYLTLHTNVVARTCSPDDGVCHNAKEYPDLTTAQAMLDSVAADCNVAIPDPQETFNGCEELGDELRFPDWGSNADWSTEIAWIEVEPTSLDGAEGTDLIIHLRDDIPNGMNDPGELESVFLWRDYGDESIELVPIYGRASFQGGEDVITVHVIEELNEVHHALVVDGLHVGDPNRDGIFGAQETTYRLVDPGSPETSYMVARLLGIVPGTPMPLANQPLTSAEVLAVTCWVEGLNAEVPADVYGAIDYDDCAAADAFGQGDPDSGHAFSKDVLPILGRCSGGGCHAAGSPAGELDLSTEAAYESLMRPSVQDPLTPLVTPGNPTNSYLMMKLWGTGVIGTQMPRDESGEVEPLPEEELATLEAWIVAGAAND